MPRRSNAFQNVVLLVHAQLASEALVTESKLLPDLRTGELREVDIYIETEAAGYGVTIEVECIDHARRATVQWVETTWARHQDLPTDKLVLVSRSGFTKQAMSKAAALGIVPLALEEAETADWTKIVGRLAHLYMDVVKSHFVVSAVVTDPEGRTQVVPVGRDVMLRKPDRTPWLTVGAALDAIMALPDVGRVIIDHMHGENLTNNTFTADYEFPEHVVAEDASGAERSIAALRMDIDATRLQTAVPLKHGRLRGAQVAYGETQSAAGRVRVSIVEREGQPIVLEVKEEQAGKWRRVVNAETESDDPHLTNGASGA